MSFVREMDVDIKFHNTTLCKPTQAPSGTPTAPSIAPSSGPSQPPTVSPSLAPSKAPTTLAPSPPGTLGCDDTHTGDYNAEALTFYVNIPYKGTIQFDASNSAVTITAMNAYDMVNTSLADDNDGDKSITLSNRNTGNYKFIVDAGTASSTYEVRITCTSDNPTAAPTDVPSNMPSNMPSNEPSNGPPKDPSSPTPALSLSPTPTAALIDGVWTDNVGLVVLVVIAAATALFVVIYVVSRCHLKRRTDVIEQAIVMPNNKPRSRSQQGNNNSIKAISMELGDVRKDQKKTLDKETKVDHSFAITSEGPGDIVNDHNEPKAADDNEVNEPVKEDSFDGMFVAKVGEDSVSNSNQKETLQHASTEGADAQEVQFHGTKGDYYDEYHHKIYEERR